MADDERNPKNAPGPFYVLNGHCISCGAPRHEAPSLVTLDDDGCYFHRQPETDRDVDDAIRAMWVSCIEVYRYGGTDLTIRRRLAELGQADLCDHPLEGHPVVLRNRVRFALADDGGAISVARRVLTWFEAAQTNGACTSPVTGNAQRAEFEHTHSERYASSRRYTIESVQAPRPTERLPMYRDPAPRHVWVLSEPDGRHPLVWLHSVLVENGAADVRWFSGDEWVRQADGASLPY
ncbi:MAG: ferredoxin [Labilithrix sp.]